ncbi:MAG: hypothetical protein ACFFCX_02355 [Candidatus Sifarchaeia archaeon]
MSNVLVGGMTSANPRIQYDFVYAVSDGRKSASTIHELLEKE